MGRRLITSISCQSGTELWCFDQQICALVRINMESLQAEAIVPPMKIIEDEDYVVEKLIGWKEKILILPAQLNRRWVIYDKNSGNLEYVNFCNENHRPAATVLIEDRLILLPVCVKDPIIILDLPERKIIARHCFEDSCLFPAYGIETGEVHVDHAYGMEIWEARVEHGNIFFLIRGTSYYGKIRDEKICLVKIHTPELLWCADFCENNIWAMGSYGKYLYQFDEKGNLLRKFLTDLQTEIARILVGVHIFLIPLEKNKIWVFDRSDEQVKNIDIEMKENNRIFPPFPGNVEYWDYVEVKHAIWFLPLRNPLLVIDADTGKSQQKEITYENGFSSDKYWKYCNYVREKRKFSSFFYEDNDGELEQYMELIQRNTDKRKEERVYCGEIIWETMVEAEHG